MLAGSSEFVDQAVDVRCSTLRARDLRASGVAGIEKDVRRYWSEELIPTAEAPAALVLAFDAPLEIRLKQAVDRDSSDRMDGPLILATLVATLGNRVSGLARWQDAAVDGDFRALKDHAAALAVQVLDHLPDPWKRSSRRQGQWIPMGGRRLVVLIEGELAPLMPLLAIGETTHAGSHAGLGLGRYALVVPRSGRGMSLISQQSVAEVVDTSFQ